MNLEPLATLTMVMKKPLVLPASPAGSRVIVEFTTVTFEGERLKATLAGPAGDWLHVGPEGTASLDFRLVVQTHDGALIYVSGQGRTDAARFASGEAPVVWAPLFETGDARYAWLNRVQAVARGTASADRVVFEVCAVA